MRCRCMQVLLLTTVTSTTTTERTIYSIIIITIFWGTNRVWLLIFPARLSSVDMSKWSKRDSFSSDFHVSSLHFGQDTPTHVTMTSSEEEDRSFGLRHSMELCSLRPAVENEALVSNPWSVHTVKTTCCMHMDSCIVEHPKNLHWVADFRALLLIGIENLLWIRLHSWIRLDWHVFFSEGKLY